MRAQFGVLHGYANLSVLGIIIVLRALFETDLCFIAENDASDLLHRHTRNLEPC